MPFRALPPQGSAATITPPAPFSYNLQLYNLQLQNRLSFPTIISIFFLANLIFIFVSLDSLPSASTTNGDRALTTISSKGNMLGSSNIGLLNQPCRVIGRKKASNLPSCGCIVYLSFPTDSHSNGCKLQTTNSILSFAVA